MKWVLVAATLLLPSSSLAGDNSLWSKLSGSGQPYERMKQAGELRGPAQGVFNAIESLRIRAEIRNKLDELAPAIAAHIAEHPNDGALVAVDVYSDHLGNNIARVRLEGFAPDPSSVVTGGPSIASAPPQGMLKNSSLSYRAFAKLSEGSVTTTIVATTFSGQTGSTAVHGLSDVARAIEQQHRAQIAARSGQGQGAGGGNTSADRDRPGGDRPGRVRGEVLVDPDNEMTIEVRPRNDVEIPDPPTV